MKKYFTIICCLFLFVWMPSCKKPSSFLNEAPSVSVDQATIFSSTAQLNIFIATMYKYGVYSIAAYRDASLSTTRVVPAVNQPFSETASDEGESSIVFGQSNGYWNPGTVNSSNIIAAEDTRYFVRWISLSQCNIILANINSVPDITAAYKAQVIGEAKFIRALNYMEMIKRYGGVPIVSAPFNPGANINVPRSSFSDCVNFIVQDCNDAIAALPFTQPGELTGRATSLAAMALKAKALLFAASPLFNTSTPYLSLGANNKLICYGNYDVNRWNLAATAAKTAIDAVESSGGVYGLIDVPANRDPAYLNPNSALNYTSGYGYPLAPGNYKNSWQTPNNPEIIFADMGNGVEKTYGWPMAQNYPAKLGNTAYNYGVGVTQNFVSQYENKQTGQPQAWNGGNDLQTIYDNLDPRFKQTVAFTGNYWTQVTPIIANYISTGGNTSQPGANFDASGCPTEMWLKKFVPDAEYIGGGGVTMTWPLLRVNELYLDYAEALNEYQGPGSETTPTIVNGYPMPPSTTNSPYDAINRIRLRSGMPILPAGLSQTQFRARVQHEREIELAFEDHRFWDVRRWLIAMQPGVMQGTMYAQQINKLTTGGYSYKIVPYENRVFYPYEYLHGFDLTEVQKGNLIQNPGW